MERFKEYYKNLTESIFMSLTPEQVKNRQKDVVQLKSKNGRIWTLDEIYDRIQPWNTLNGFIGEYGRMPDHIGGLNMWAANESNLMTKNLMNSLGIRFYNDYFDAVAEMIFEKAIWPEEDEL